MPAENPADINRFVLEHLKSPELIQAILRPSSENKEERVTIRAVQIKGSRMLQISTYDGKKTDVKNYLESDFDGPAQSILFRGFRSLFISLTTEEIQIQQSKNGKPIVHRKRRQVEAMPSLRHDRIVNRPLPEGEPDPFLRCIGMMTSDGRIKADRQRKFQQINDFIRIVTESKDMASLEARPLLIVDFGCGNAYLSFALHYYLNSKLGVETELIGVDRDPEAIDRDIAKADSLGSESISFSVSSIADYVSPRPANIVTALHACDTATDEALAKALSYDAELIFAAPCCHHDIQVQMSVSEMAASSVPMMRDGIIKERLGDLITDTARAMLLRIAGYKVDVIQFAAPEHTAKNLMIRAVKSRTSNKQELIQEYCDLKQTYGVVPYLEKLLPPEVRMQLEERGTNP
jgi:SAM-dependent methyltransferase